MRLGRTQPAEAIANVVGHARQRAVERLGQVVVPYLARLDKSRLDSEQRYRLKRIAEDLAVFLGDRSVTAGHSVEVLAKAKPEVQPSRSR